MGTPSHHVLAIALVAGSLVLGGCTNSPAEQKAATDNELGKIEDQMAESKTAPSPRAWELDRIAILKDLRELRANIDEKIADTDVQLRSRRLTASERRGHEAMKTELSKEKVVVEAMIDKAEGATDATWSTTKAELTKGTEDVKGWWARLKENIDKKTDTDLDKDGH